MRRLNRGKASPSLSQSLQSQWKCTDLIITNNKSLFSVSTLTVTKPKPRPEDLQKEMKTLEATGLLNWSDSETDKE